MKQIKVDTTAYSERMKQMSLLWVDGKIGTVQMVSEKTPVSIIIDGVIYCA